MKAFKKVIFTTDFRETSQKAREAAELLRKTMDCDLEIVHVFDSATLEVPAPYYFMPGVDNWMAEHLDKMRTRGREALDHLCAEMGGVPGYFLEGKPGHVLTEFAAERGADLIVMGTHGHTGWDRMVLGSVAEYVVRHADCGVLTIKPDKKPD